MATPSAVRCGEVDAGHDGGRTRLARQGADDTVGLKRPDLVRTLVENLTGKAAKMSGGKRRCRSLWRWVGAAGAVCTTDPGAIKLVEPGL
jgi:hypothetical protein